MSDLLNKHPNVLPAQQCEKTGGTYHKLDVNRPSLPFPINGINASVVWYYNTFQVYSRGYVTVIANSAVQKITLWTDKVTITYGRLNSVTAQRMNRYDIYYIIVKSLYCIIRIDAPLFIG